MKNYKKSISFILVFCIMLTTFGSISFAEQNVGQASVQETLRVTEDGAYIDNVYYTQEEFGDLLDNAQVIEISSDNSNNDEMIAPMSLVLAAGTYYIVGIGTVVITEVGKIIVAGVIVKAGSWMYDKIMNWFEARSAAADIPNRLKKPNGNVDTGLFNKKVRGSSDLEEKKGWRISKDRDGHKGSEWKVKNKSGKRVASIDKNGKVVGK